MLEDGVEGHEQFSHTCCQGNFLRLSGCQQPLIELPDDGIAAPGCKRSHVQGSATATHSSLASHCAAVAAVGSHSVKRAAICLWFSVPRAPLRKPETCGRPVPRLRELCVVGHPSPAKQDY